MEKLLDNGYFTREELKNIVPIFNKCPNCKKLCGHIYTLKCCGLQVCATCMDKLYDEEVVCSRCCKIIEPL